MTPYHSIPSNRDAVRENDPSNFPSFRLLGQREDEECPRTLLDQNENEIKPTFKSLKKVASMKNIRSEFPLVLQPLVGRVFPSDPLESSALERNLQIIELHCNSKLLKTRREEGKKPSQSSKGKTKGTFEQLGFGTEGGFLRLHTKQPSDDIVTYGVQFFSSRFYLILRCTDTLSCVDLNVGMRKFFLDEFLYLFSEEFSYDLRARERRSSPGHCRAI